MFLNSPVRIFNAISNSTLTTVNNDLYENGIRKQQKMTLTLMH